MSRNVSFALGALGCSVVYLALAQNSSPIAGQWTLGGPVVQDKVQLSIRRSSATSNMSSSFPVSLSQLRGATRAQLDSSGTVARFDVVRDAGTLHFEGYLQGGAGGGTFTFSPNPNFASDMRSLGYSGLTDEKVFTMAVHDVSAAYIRDMNAAGIRPESSDQLITMRIHNVTVEYVRELKGLGYSDLVPDKLVTMRIHGVTVDFARELKGMGYNSVSPDQMVTMRIHGASTDFIKEVNALGYNHPGVDQLVTMRIHGVTAEYIRKTRSLGMGNLPIDQLVSLRIHGIVE
jgi:hypothetical protein